MALVARDSLTINNNQREAILLKDEAKSTELKISKLKIRLISKLFDIPK